MRRRKLRAQRRVWRHRRVRKKVEGSPERPRLCVFRSGKHIYAQVIDDYNQHTLVSCSTLQPDLREQRALGNNVESAAKVGKLIARQCIERGITALVFDRGGYAYHGRVRALAQAAREQFKEAGVKGF